MVIEPCTCDGLPPHDHVLDYGPHDGVHYGRPTPDIARVWVDWREVARSLWANPVVP